ncbi:TetR family transcriptional regulator [Murinocardiopsis flavida]|uniref:TetR family transcriptional regulator n=1 Tax=Murinocardiopsis flavida TaxID=645275 RepID=A0A2P8D8Q3_9ACTN|nr:TetR/AcrR family transcriptional regulator [Murinocardiopsis flavida]PSK93606.1 TetR family transcriptional regulator [Murinocardiopsis flavida]
MTESASSKPGSRHRILVAAATMLGENPAARLSVRSVAARAGVSTGSLRHHFPTQRVLEDAVLAGIYDLVAPDDPIHDTDTPARDRLVGCLRQILAPTGTGRQARAALRQTYETLIATEPTEETRQGYLALERTMQHRVEHWLAVLADEGALPHGDNAQRAKFLLTVVNGLTLERALPSAESVLVSENAALFAAVDAILGG